jgi:tRNA (Thr-GGU) A37 N-methylase
MPLEFGLFHLWRVIANLLPPQVGVNALDLGKRPNSICKAIARILTLSYF